VYRHARKCCTLCEVCSLSQALTSGPILQYTDISSLIGCASCHVILCSLLIGQASCHVTVLASDWTSVLSRDLVLASDWTSVLSRDFVLASDWTSVLPRDFVLACDWLLLLDSSTHMTLCRSVHCVSKVF